MRHVVFSSLLLFFSQTGLSNDSEPQESFTAWGTAFGSCRSTDLPSSRAIARERAVESADQQCEHGAKRISEWRDWTRLIYTHYECDSNAYFVCKNGDSA